jgi:DNA-binding transcriptional LysR family regulator
MPSPPSLRKLQYIVAVAREQHFRKAAEKLHVSQPAVSRQIRQCEDDFGFKILERDHHFVTLTKAGRSFVGDIDGILERLESDFHKAIIRAQAIDRQTGSEYVLAHSPYAPSVIRHLARKLQRSVFGKRRLRLRILPTVEMLIALECDVIQAGITFAPIDSAGVASIPIGTDHWAAVVPATNKLAQLRTIDVAQLREFPVISNGAERTHPFLFRRIQEQYAARGIRLRAIAEVTSPTEAFDLVRDNVGICLLPESVCNDLPPGVRAIRIKDLPVLETVLIHRLHHAEYIPALTEHLRKAIGRPADTRRSSRASASR